jgi:hypothetical protein
LFFKQLSLKFNFCVGYGEGLLKNYSILYMTVQFNTHRHYFENRVALNIVLLLILSILFSCKKKKEVLPDNIWHQLTNTIDRINGADTIGNELVLLSNGDLYRIDADGNFIEKKQLPFTYDEQAILYHNHYITTTTNGISLDSFTTNFTSIKNQSVFHLNHAAFKQQDSTSPAGGAIVYSKDFGVNDFSAIFVENRYPNNFTKDYFSLFLYKINQDVNGNIKNVAIQNVFSLNGIPTVPFPEKLYIYKNKYILVSEYGDVSYLVYSNGTYKKLFDKQIIPYYIYSDTLYASVGNDFCKSGDGENWIVVQTNADFYYNSLSLINNRIIYKNGDIKEYNSKTNTFRKLNIDGTGNYVIDYIIYFNGYVYLSNYTGLYRKKIEFFFD